MVQKQKFTSSLHIACVAVFPFPLRQARVARRHGDSGNEKKIGAGGRGRERKEGRLFLSSLPLPLVPNFLLSPHAFVRLPLGSRFLRRLRCIRPGILSGRAIKLFLCIHFTRPVGRGRISLIHVSSPQSSVPSLRAGSHFRCYNRRGTTVRSREVRVGEGSGISRARRLTDS